MVREGRVVALLAEEQNLCEAKTWVSSVKWLKESVHIEILRQAQEQRSVM